MNQQTIFPSTLLVPFSAMRCAELFLSRTEKNEKQQRQTTTRKTFIPSAREHFNFFGDKRQRRQTNDFSIL